MNALASNPLFSVLVVTWNGKHLLGECLDSLRAQTLRDFEVILVDNGSTDGTLEFVVENYPEVRTVVFEENRGFAGGNNAGLAHAQGTRIALLNNDAVADPAWLQELDRGLRDNPQYFFIASRVVLADRPELLDSAGDGMAIVGAAFKRGHLQPSARFDQAGEIFGASGAAACYRRSMLEDIGFFDERFFCLYEDADLSFRARLCGYRCLYWPAAVVSHRVNSTLGTRSRQSVFWGQRNLELLYHKNMPVELRHKYRWSRRAFHLASSLYFLLRGRAGVYWEAKKAARRMIAEIQPVVARVPVEQIDAHLERRWIRTRVRGK